jgi:hypothetical protein
VSGSTAPPLRERRGMMLLCLAGAALTPAIILAAVSILFLPQNLLNNIAAPDSMSIETPAVLTSLMSDMANMGIGLLVVNWFLYRQPLVVRARKRSLMMVICATVFGLVSIFAGLRGEYALAFVISSQPFQLALVSGFIEVQAGALVLQLMATSAVGCHFLIFRDRRTILP